MTEATHFSQCVHDQQRRLEAEDRQHPMCPINFRWEETYTPTMHSASLTLAPQCAAFAQGTSFKLSAEVYPPSAFQHKNLAGTPD